MVRTPPMRAPFGNKLRAYDKTSGKVVWEMQLPAGATGAIMTYQHGGKQYIVVAIGGGSYSSEYLAFSLPDSERSPPVDQFCEIFD